MTTGDRDVQRAARMVAICDEIAKHVRDYDMTPESFEATRLYQLAINNLLAQIGELSVHLDPCFRAAIHDDEVYWNDLRGFRNIAVHQYERLEPLACYQFATEEAPALRGMLLACPEVQAEYEADACDTTFHSDDEDPLSQSGDVGSRES